MNITEVRRFVYQIQCYSPVAMAPQILSLTTKTKTWAPQDIIHPSPQTARATSMQERNITYPLKTLKSSCYKWMCVQCFKMIIVIVLKLWCQNICIQWFQNSRWPSQNQECISHDCREVSVASCRLIGGVIVMKVIFHLFALSDTIFQHGCPKINSH